MTYCGKLSVWLCFGSALALCVIWGAAADEQASILAVTEALPGDWPDTAFKTDNSSTATPTHQSNEEVIAGTEIVNEMTSTRTVHSVFVSTPSAAVAAPPTRASPSIPPPEDMSQAQSTSASNSSSALSSPEATLNMPATPPAVVTQTISSTPRMKLTQPPNLRLTSPSKTPTLTPGFSPPSPADRTEEKWEEEKGVKKEMVPEKARKEPVCDFDPCVHLQRPCPEEREVKGWRCRCPGLTSDPSVTPDPVVALEIMTVWPRAASVRWCAPYSALSAFLVWVLRQDGSAISNSSVSSWARQTNVFGLEAGHKYSVCVSSLNGLGLSHKRCVPVSTPQDTEAIALHTLIGGCAALLMLAVVLSVCLYTQCKRGQMQGTPALLNPTMQTLHDPRLTSLVSISNPAYANSDEQTALSSGNTHYTQGAQSKKSTNVNKK